MGQRPAQAGRAADVGGAAGGTGGRGVTGRRRGRPFERGNKFGKWPRKAEERAEEDAEGNAKIRGENCAGNANEAREYPWEGPAGNAEAGKSSVEAVRGQGPEASRAAVPRVPEPDAELAEQLAWTVPVPTLARIVSARIASGREAELARELVKALASWPGGESSGAAAEAGVPPSPPHAQQAPAGGGVPLPTEKRQDGQPGGWSGDPRSGVFVRRRDRDPDRPVAGSGGKWGPLPRGGKVYGDEF